jgi:hypothetical protein
MLLAPAEAPATHDASFWRSIVENDYALPPGESAADLLDELTPLLGSADAEERDTFGYGIPAHWIYRQRLLSADELQHLVRSWSANLRAGIGSTGDDGVLLRSFSALDLSILAALDNVEPFLEPDQRRALLDAALGYLADERDLRGYVAGKGWLHSAAHTADLLKFLARSDRLAPADQGRILAAIEAKLDVSMVYTWGEDERLARAVLSVVRRDDFDRAEFDRWLARLAAGADGMWEGELDPRRFQAVQNAKNLLRSLLVLVSNADGSAQEVRGAILTTLGKL